MYIFHECAPLLIHITIQVRGTRLIDKPAVFRIYKLLDELEPGALKQNLHYRFPTEQIDKILPHIRVSFIFRDARYFNVKRLSLFFKTMLYTKLDNSKWIKIV